MANKSDSYLWSNGSTKQWITVTPEETTTYSVSVIQNGCEATDEITVNVENTLINATAGEDQTIDAGESVKLIARGGTSYIWTDNGLTDYWRTVTPTETTTYTVTITNGNCSADYEVTVFVNEIVDPCVKEAYNVIAYPNPVSHIGNLNIKISIQEDQEINYAFFKMDGKRIGPSKTKNVQRGCNVIDVDMVKHCNFKPSTNYFLIVNGNGWTKTIQVQTL